MISYIKGELTEIMEDAIVVENNGIGFNIRVPAGKGIYIFADKGRCTQSLWLSHKR